MADFARLNSTVRMRALRSIEYGLVHYFQAIDNKCAKQTQNCISERTGSATGTRSHFLERRTADGYR